MRTLILGLGNPQLVDEHMGLDVARGLHAKLSDPDVDIIEASAVGMNIFEIAAGYNKVVVVDCIRHGEGDVGELQRLGLADLELVQQRRSGSDTEYRATLELAAGNGGVLPFEISIYAIEMGVGALRDDGIDAMAEGAVPRLVAEIAREEFGASMPESDWF